MFRRILTKIKQLKEATVGLRKLIFATQLLIVTTLLVIYAVIDGSDYALIWSTVGPAFMAANVLSKFSYKGTPREEAE